MDLGPARRGDASVDLEEQKTRRVEPGLGGALVQVALTPRALLGVVGEGRVVLFEPGRLIVMGFEVSKDGSFRNLLDRNG